MPEPVLGIHPIQLVFDRGDGMGVPAGIIPRTLTADRFHRVHLWMSRSLLLRLQLLEPILAVWRFRDPNGIYLALVALHPGSSRYRW